MNAALLAYRHNSEFAERIKLAAELSKLRPSHAMMPHTPASFVFTHYAAATRATPFLFTAVSMAAEIAALQAMRPVAANTVYTAAMVRAREVASDE